MVAGEARRVTDPKIVAEESRRCGRRADGPAQPDDSGTGITRAVQRADTRVRRRGSSTKSSRAPRPAVGTAEEDAGFQRVGGF